MACDSVESRLNNVVIGPKRHAPHSKFLNTMRALVVRTVRTAAAGQRMASNVTKIQQEFQKMEGFTYQKMVREGGLHSACTI